MIASITLIITLYTNSTLRSGFGIFVCIIWLFTSMSLLFNVYLMMIRPKDKDNHSFEYNETVCIVVVRIFILNSNIWLALIFSSVLLLCLLFGLRFMFIL